jgi:protein CpxP
MKKMFVFAVLMIGMASFAQEKPVVKKMDRAKMERLTPEQRNEQHLKKLTTDLGLNESQQKQMAALLSEQSAKREAKKAEREKLMQAKRTERNEEMKAFDTKVKAILTPDQSKKWDEMKAERREKVKEKVQEKRKRAEKK